MISVLIADDSMIFRRLMREALMRIDGCEIVGEASNGRLALEKITGLQPDLVTLDLEMPVLGGMDVLTQLKMEPRMPAVVVISAHTLRGSEITIKALECGAFDFITKPQTGSPEAARDQLMHALKPILKSLAIRRDVRSILQNPVSRGPVAPPGEESPEGGVQTQRRVASSGEGSSGIGYPAIRNSGAGSAPADRQQHPATDRHRTPAGPVSGREQVLPAGAERTPSSDSVMIRARPAQKPGLLVIGISTGGPNALSELIPALPGDLGIPVLIVQHMPPLFTRSLADSLNKKSALTVIEAEAGMTVQPNWVYVAPGGRHMRAVAMINGGIGLQITDDAPENNCRPSVDYLFRSVAQHLPGKALAVIMTGMGNDGTLGVRLLKRTGSMCLIQDEATCVVYGMPRAVAEAGLADGAVPLTMMAAAVTRIIR
ncbi:MAG: chemotaxis signal relay system protein-glutamate methylesterase CheB [Bacteroidetes bacterium HLUCCA01]|nr:MAG: chemotaxis signal relay system protein-glutamate methylesterase CheB [Bacteroidetes bacterium HLUCCA01]